MSWLHRAFVTCMFVVGLSGILYAVPVRSQTVTVTGFTITTTSQGVLTVTIVPSGGNFLVTLTQDGVQRTQSTVSQAQIETTVNSAMAARLASTMGFAIHVFSVSPLSVTIISVEQGQTIPANWWLEQ